MAEQVIELLHELNREDGQTIVLVTHDLGIGSGAGRLIRMRDGRLVGDRRQPSDGQLAAVGRHAAVGAEG
jgi:putative ABC transport system ATP-binding protein